MIVTKNPSKINIITANAIQNLTRLACSATFTLSSSAESVSISSWNNPPVFDTEVASFTFIGLLLC